MLLPVFFLKQTQRLRIVAVTSASRAQRVLPALAVKITPRARIRSVTKELNDLFVFDMHKENWICLFEEINSPVRPNLVNLSSPGLLQKSKSVLA